MMLKTGTIPALTALLLTAFVLVSPAPASADCDYYAGQLSGLEGRISQIAGQSNSLNAQLESAIAQFNSHAQSPVEPNSKGALEALRAMRQSNGQAVAICGQRIQLQTELVGLWQEFYSLSQSGVSEGCYSPELLDAVLQTMDAERSSLRGLEQVCAQFPEVQDSLNRDIAELEAMLGQGDEPPTVRIVNNMGIPACIHPGGQSAGMCIDPGQERVYRLDKLYGLDTDTNQRMPTKTIVVVGGGHWAGSPYTEYQGMTVCTKKRFGHESGEEVWYITGGLEGNCGIRGYHQ